MNIGVFDSGLGGLSIYRDVLKLLPEYNYIYLGDNARVPYGGRSKELIYEFTKNAVDYLFKKDCQLVILACNAASSNALRRLQHEYLPTTYPNRRILGVIRPVVEKAVESNAKRIGIMATRATVASNSYLEEIHHLSPDTNVFQQACPLLVPMIEENEMEWEGFDMLIERYLAPLLEKNIEDVILACTHYGLIIEKIEKYLPKSVKVISQGKATAEKLVDYLQRHPEIESKLAHNKQRSYFATDHSQKYENQVKLFLGEHFHPEAKLQFISL